MRYAVSVLTLCIVFLVSPLFLFSTGTQLVEAQEVQVYGVELDEFPETGCWITPHPIFEEQLIDGMNVRQEPSTESPEIGILPMGYYVEAQPHEQDRRWFQLTGVNGYVWRSSTLESFSCRFVLTPTALPATPITSNPTITPTPTAVLEPTSEVQPLVTPSFVETRLQPISTSDCGLYYEKFVVIRDGTSDSPGMRVEDMANMFDYLSEHVISDARVMTSDYTVLQYMPSADFYPVLQLDSSANPLTVGLAASVWYDIDTCSISRDQAPESDNLLIAAVHVNDVGSNAQIVAGMAHEICHLLGCYHGSYSPDYVSTRDDTIHYQSDAYFWDKVVEDAFYDCADWVPTIIDEDAQLYAFWHCRQIIDLLGL